MNIFHKKIFWNKVIWCTHNWFLIFERECSIVFLDFVNFTFWIRYVSTFIVQEVDVVVFVTIAGNVVYNLYDLILPNKLLQKISRTIYTILYCLVKLVWISKLILFLLRALKSSKTNSYSRLMFMYCWSRIKTNDTSWRDLND